MSNQTTATPSIGDNKGHNIFDDKLKSQFKDVLTPKNDLKIENLICGETPDRIRERCLELCQTYIGGSWKKISVDKIMVTRIPGGLTNQLYRVTLDNSAISIDQQTINEPRELAIKFYQPKHLKILPNNSREPERLSDTVIATIVSQTGIGPTLYGVFEDGIIQEYYKHKLFRIEHQQNPEMVTKLARIMARVNLLNVPVPKKRDQYLETLQSKLDDGYREHNLPELAKQYGLDILAKNDLRQEFDRLASFLRRLTAPTVFCHNDFRGSNIMVTDEQRLVICDFEYSTYGPRGHDIASVLVEWDKEFLDFLNWKIPSDQVIIDFVQRYLEGCDQIQPGYSSKASNSVETIVREVKIFMLPIYLLFVGFMFGQKESLVKEFPFDVEQKLCEKDLRQRRETRKK